MLTLVSYLYGSPFCIDTRADTTYDSASGEPSRAKVLLLLLGFPFPYGKGLGVRFLKGISKGQSVSRLMLSIAKKLRRGMTPEEQRFWREVRGNRLDGLHFRRQQIIGRYVVDFFCEAADLAVELDGAGHILSVEEDKLRDHELGRRGIEVMRIPNQELSDDLDAVLRRIAHCAQLRISDRHSGSPPRTGRG
jgi:very-short-patch-repair endonuclease